MQSISKPTYELWYSNLVIFVVGLILALITVGHLMPTIDEIFERIIRLDERVSRIDEKIDSLIEAAAAAPSATEQTPPPAEGSDTAKDRWPDNAYQAVGFAFNKLGKLGTPIFVILIIVGAFLFLQEYISTINQRDESLRKLFSETTKSTLETGKNVIDSTSNLIELNTKLGLTGKKLLDLQLTASNEREKAANQREIANTKTREAERAGAYAAKLRDSLTKEEKKLKQAKAKLETEQTALAKERGEIDLAQADVAAREGLLRDFDAELSRTQATIVSLKKDLKRLREKGEDEQGRSKKELTALRAKLKTLLAEQAYSRTQIAALEKQSDDLLYSLQRARTTIRAIGTAKVPDLPKLELPAAVPVEPKKPSQIDVVAKILRRYAKAPDTVTSNDWDRLDEDDVTPGELDKLLQMDLGYKLVLKVNFTKMDDGVEKAFAVYFPVRRATSDQIIGVPALQIAEDGTK